MMEKLGYMVVMWDYMRVTWDCMRVMWGNRRGWLESIVEMLGNIVG